MPLAGPPAVEVLAALPVRQTAGMLLHRVFRAERSDPWFFSSVPAGGDPLRHGRFDLPAPDGACYLATSPVAAVLETFQHLMGGLLPDDELRSRDRAQVTAPPGSPPAVNLTAARSRGAGVHAALWADHDRARTQAWADQLRRAGHRALLHGIQHDPTGRLRAVTLLDKAGAHAPYDDDLGWRPTRHRLHGDAVVAAALARYGITVTRSDVMLPVVRLEDSGLL